MELYKQNLVSGKEECPCKERNYDQDDVYSDEYYDDEESIGNKTVKDGFSEETKTPDFIVGSDIVAEDENEDVGLSGFDKMDEEKGGDYKDELIRQLEEEIEFLRAQRQESLLEDDQLSACHAEKTKVQTVSEDRRLRLSSLLAKNKRLLEKYHTCHSEKGDRFISIYKVCL